MANEIKKQYQTEQDAWQSLKKYTTARIALGKTGTAIPLTELLQFRLAHAHARDAVYSQLDTDRLVKALQSFQLPVFLLNSRAANRHEYLQRPDLGRRLNDASVAQLKDAGSKTDITLIIADGLSATAINNHLTALSEALIPQLKAAGFSIAPLCIVQQARVAVGDEVASLLNASMSIVLIGERPGLSSPDSLGAYLTYQPSIGLTDESRNCISNIRTEGLSYTEAAAKIFYLVKEAFRLQYSGVQLKDNTGLLQ